MSKNPKITISYEVEKYEQTFSVKVVGVTYENDDGTDRQSLIRELKVGEEVTLVREPDNPKDELAIAVYNLRGQQLGYLPHDRRLANHLDKQGPVESTVKAVIGGTGCLGQLFGAKKKSYGCVLLITKGDFDFSKLAPYLDKDREIDRLIKEVGQIEKSNPDLAISEYRRAIDLIKEMDGLGEQAKEWRTARYPVNRLTLLLEQSKRYEEALQEIQLYEDYHDQTGLTKTELTSVSKRKERLTEKLSKKK